MDMAPGIKRRQSRTVPRGYPCACVRAPVCVSVMHLHPQSWIYGLINTCLTQEMGLGHYPVDHLASLMVHVSPCQPCCSKALPGPGQAMSARLREKAS